jgi:hypothetical protein
VSRTEPVSATPKAARTFAANILRLVPRAIDVRHIEAGEEGDED